MTANPLCSHVSLKELAATEQLQQHTLVCTGIKSDGDSDQLKHLELCKPAKTTVRPLTGSDGVGLRGVGRERGWRGHGGGGGGGGSGGRRQAEKMGRVVVVMLLYSAVWIEDEIL